MFFSLNCFVSEMRDGLQLLRAERGQRQLRLGLVDARQFLLERNESPFSQVTVDGFKTAADFLAVSFDARIVDAV